MSDEDDIVSDLDEIMNELLRQRHVDYSIRVYCDHHFAVQMRLARSVTLAEHGVRQASADVNSLTIWRCPKPGCDRCYEASMYGYFGYPNEMGSRIQPSLERQPRGNHDGLPFILNPAVGRDDQALLGRLRQQKMTEDAP
jgi:hypothetical protein